jgi:tape measure domain-containing protein
MSVVANVAINIDGRQAQDLLKSIQGEVKKLNGTFEELDTSSKKTQGGFDGIGQKAAILAAKFFTIKAAVDTVKKSLEVAFERGATEQRLKNLTSSTGEYEAALGAAAKIANDFGISQNQASRELTDLYARLQGAGFGLKEVTEIYRGFEAIAKTTGTTNEVASRTFLQLEQALSKGKLQGQDFLSVASNMPGVLDAIAAEAGVARGELQEMGSRGEITGDLIFRALAKANEGFDGIESRLNDQQKAFNNLGTVTETLQTQLGNLFGPAVVAGVELLAAAGQQLSEWWDYLGENVLPRVLKAIQPVVEAFQNLWDQVPWETIVGYLQGAILIGVQRITQAVELLSPMIAFIVNKFVELAQNPVFEFIAEQVGRLADMLGISNQEVSNFTIKQKEAAEEAAKLVNNFSSLPPEITSSKDAAAELRAEIEAAKAPLAELNAEQDKLTNSIENSLKVAEARHQAESAIRDVIKDQLKNQLSQAKSQKERIAIAKKIYNIEIANAKSALALALQRIQAEVDRANIAIKTQELKLQELDVEMKILNARGENTAKIQQAVASQRTALDIARSTAQTVQQIAGHQTRTAQATFEAQKNAAALAYQQNIVAKNTNAAANESQRLASGFEKAAAASSQIQRRPGVERILEENDPGAFRGPRTQTSTLTAAEFRALQEASRMSLSGSLNFFAKGGVVNKPTLGVIGEAGTEYIVPESKAANFAANYLSGARGDDALNAGSSIPAINIQTGPVMQQDGQRYVTISDLESAMQQVAGTLLGNGRTAGSRRYAGVR